MTYKSKKLHKTALGSLILISSLLVLAILYVVLGAEVFQRNSPIIVSSEQLADESSFSLKELSLFFALMDVRGNLLHLNSTVRRALKLEAAMINFFTRDGQAGSSQEKLVVETCSNDHFDQHTWDLLSKQIALEYMMCVNPTKIIRDNKEYDDEITIKNQYSLPGGRTFWLEVSLCSEEEDPGCRKWLETTDKFYFVASVLDNFIDVRDYNNPIKSNSTSINFQLSKNLNVIHLVSYSRTNLELDWSYIFEIADNETFISIGQRSTQMSEFNNKSKSIFELLIESQKKVRKVSRRYVKLHEIVASLAAISRIVLFFTKMIVSSIDEFDFYNVLAEELASEEGKKKEKNSVLSISERPITITLSDYKVTFFEWIWHLVSSSKGKVNKERVFSSFDSYGIHRRLQNLEKSKTDRSSRSQEGELS